MEQKEKMISSQPVQITEDAWIAKYRAALEATPPEQSPRPTLRETLRNAINLLDSRLHAMLDYSRQLLRRGLFRRPARHPVQQLHASSRRAE